jgi:LPXTG-motif cell wall-anchored protein
VKKIMLLLAVSAMVVLLFAPMATARQHRDDGTATATATATATPTATASGTATAGGGGKLPKTGGPESMALLAGVILVGSGVVSGIYLRRREVS